VVVQEQDGVDRNDRPPRAALTNLTTLAAGA
jgi:hypothetical protein